MSDITFELSSKVYSVLIKPNHMSKLEFHMYVLFEVMSSFALNVNSIFIPASHWLKVLSQEKVISNVVFRFASTVVSVLSVYSHAKPVPAFFSEPMAVVVLSLIV